MAVIHYALRWQMSQGACAAAAAVAARARAGDAAGLSGLGEQLHRVAVSSPSILAAFALDDPDHVGPWLVPDAVQPALVTLLAWVPELVLLGDSDAGVLAALYRRGGSPVAPLAAAGSVFYPLPRALAAVFGRSRFGARPSAGQTGMWARPSRLARRLRRHGEGAAAEQVAAMAGPDPERAWLVTTTLW